MSVRIQPKILQGTRDFGPDEMAKRNFVTSKIVKVFESFGYQTIETPSIEYAETLLGKYGSDADKLVYRFPDRGGRDIALRYDQTVPTARYVAMNIHTLPMPFKRYQISKVWRAERPQKGRYREFYQCDIDILGTDSLMADAEAALLGTRVFESLGVPIVCKINNRQFLNSVLNKNGVPEASAAEVIRIIDKLDKIGASGVEEQLGQLLDKGSAERILKAICVSGSNEEKLDLLAEYDVSGLRDFFGMCRELEVPHLSFEPSLARGLDYYTGTIYEFICPKVTVGSICGGGRYDNLCGMFSEKRVPGVGWAIGFDRTMVVMEELGLLKNITSGAKVLVVVFDRASLPYCATVLKRFADFGVSAELYTGDDLKMAKQMRYADHKKIPYVAVCGPDEIEGKKVAVKNMKSGEQQSILISEIERWVKEHFS